MNLSITALTYAAAILWGLCFLLVGMANLLWPPYGGAFLELMSSVYPGYRAAASLGNVIVGTLYAVVDGAIGGALFAWVYNAFAR
ncbi:MAG: hypothetical protein HYV01_04690 [Deltaproteobacteria bacterium]|jgi:hypothetical protein|nr:hypothetical protein [Deltaproteobacteria bacterium]